MNLPQYSDKALFEAVVNAVAHRDYSMRASKIRLSMFEDRLEIQSPGSLPNNLTIDSMATRQATRNEALTSVLGRMPVRGVRGSEDRQYFMERRGDGVPIILSETRKLCGKTPEYQPIDESEVCLTIPAAAQEQSPARTVITVWSVGHPLPGADRPAPRASTSRSCSGVLGTVTPVRPHPIEVIQHATSNGARALGLTQTGVIRAGFEADMAIMDGNPLHNLKVLYGTGIDVFEDGQMVRRGGVKYTIKDGIVFDAPALLQDVVEMVRTAKGKPNTT